MQEDASSAAGASSDPSEPLSFPRQLGDLELVTALDPDPPLQVLGGQIEERPCLVYVQTAAAAGSREALEAYRRGAQQASLVQHPGFVRVVWVEPEGHDSVHVAVEHVDAPGLSELLSAPGQLSPRRAMRLVWSLCRAVGAAHRVGLVHGQLSPLTILVPSPREPRITGLHRRRGTGAGLEAPPDVFSAPEIHSRPDQSPSPPADVYSLGALLVYVLTGGGPDPERSLCSRRPEVHPDLETISNKALHPDPFKRYPSADALAADLAALRDGKIPQAAVQAARNDRPAAVKTRAWLGGAFLLVTGLVVGYLGTGRNTSPHFVDDRPGGRGQAGSSSAKVDPDLIATELDLLSAAATSVSNESRAGLELLAQLPDRQETAAARAGLLVSLVRARMTEVSNGQANLPEVRLLGKAFCLDPEGAAGIAAFELLAEASLLAGHDLTARRMYARLARWLPAGQAAGLTARRRLIQLELRAGELAAALTRLAALPAVEPDTRAVLPGRPDLVPLHRLSRLQPLLASLANHQPLLGGAPARTICTAGEPGEPASLLAWQGSALTWHRPDAEISRLQAFDPAEVPIAMAVADLGETGRQELIAVTEHRETRKAWLTSVSLGTPGRPVTFRRELGAHITPGLLCLGDLDGNGTDDVVVGLGQPMGGCLVLLVHPGRQGASCWRVDERTIAFANPISDMVCVPTPASSDLLVVSTTGPASQVQVFSVERSSGLFTARRLEDSSGVEALAATTTEGAPAVVMVRGSASTGSGAGDITLVSLAEGAPRSRWLLPSAIARVGALTVGRPRGEDGPAVVALTGQAGDGSPLTYLHELRRDEPRSLWLPGGGPCLFIDLRGNGAAELVLGAPARILGALSRTPPTRTFRPESEWPHDHHHRRLAAARTIESCGQAAAALAAYANLATVPDLEPVVQREAWLGEARCHLALGDLDRAKTVTDKALDEFTSVTAQSLLINAAIAERLGLEDRARSLRRRAWQLDGLPGQATAAPPASGGPPGFAPLVRELWHKGNPSVSWQTETAFRFYLREPGELEVRAPSLIPAALPPGPTWPATLVVPVTLDGGPVAVDVEWLGATEGRTPRVLVGLFEGDDPGLTARRMTYGETSAILVAIDVRPVADSVADQRRVRVTLKLRGQVDHVVGSFAANEPFTASLTIDPRLQRAVLSVLPKVGVPRQLVVKAMAPGRGPALFGVVSQAALPRSLPLVPSDGSHPRFMPGAVRLGALALRVPPDSSASLRPARHPAASFARQAMGALALGQADRSHALLGQALALDPKHYMARLAQSWLLDEQPEAYDDAAWALAEQPAWTLPRLLAARRLPGRDLLRPALEKAGRLLDSRPRTYLESAKSLLLAGEPARALVTSYRSAELPGFPADIALLRARTFQLLGAHKLALGLIQTALAASPDDAGALASRALTMLHLGQAQQARKDLDRAIAASTSPRGEWFLLRGRCLAALGQVKSAARDLDRAADLLGPRQPRSLSLWRTQLKKRLSASR